MNNIFTPLRYSQKLIFLVLMTALSVTNAIATDSPPQESAQSLTVLDHDLQHNLQHNLQQQQIYVQKVNLAFHMLTFMEGDPKYLELMQQEIDKADETFKQFKSTNNLYGEDDINELSQHWISFFKAAKANKFIKDNNKKHDDNRDQTEFQFKAERLNNKIEALSSKYPSTEEEKRWAFHQQALLMQKIAARYAQAAASLEDNASGNGKKAKETTNHNQQSIDKLSKEFEKKLISLINRFGSDPINAERLNGVALKWHFIQKSLANYNQNTVPYLVSRYSQQIVDQLKVTE